MLAGPWYVQHAVTGTGAIMYIFKILIVAAHLKTFFNLVSINLTEGLMIPACPSLVFFLKKGTTYSLKICAWCFCMDVLYISVISVWTGFVDLSMLLQLGSFEMSTTFGRVGSSGGDPVAVDRILKSSN